MHRVSSLAVAAFVVLVPVWTAGAAPTHTPNVVLQQADGSPVPLAAYEGKVLLVDFWASWCVPCVQEHAALTNAARLMGGDARFYGVVYEDEEARAKDFLAMRGSAYPSLADPDSKTAIAYGVFGVPETYFISPGGTIADKFVGPLTPDAIAELVAKARSLGR